MGWDGRGGAGRERFLEFRLRLGNVASGLNPATNPATCEYRV